MKLMLLVKKETSSSFMQGERYALNKLHAPANESLQWHGKHQFK